MHIQSFCIEKVRFASGLKAIVTWALRLADTSVKSHAGCMFARKKKTLPELNSKIMRVKCIPQQARRKIDRNMAHCWKGRSLKTTKGVQEGDLLGRLIDQKSEAMR